MFCLCILINDALGICQRHISKRKPTVVYHPNKTEEREISRNDLTSKTEKEEKTRRESKNKETSFLSYVLPLHSRNNCGEAFQSLDCPCVFSQQSVFVTHLPRLCQQSISDWENSVAVDKTEDKPLLSFQKWCWVRLIIIAIQMPMQMSCKAESCQMAISYRNHSGIRSRFWSFQIEMVRRQPSKTSANRVQSFRIRSGTGHVDDRNVTEVAAVLFNTRYLRQSRWLSSELGLWSLAQSVPCPSVHERTGRCVSNIYGLVLFGRSMLDKWRFSMIFFLDDGWEQVWFGGSADRTANGRFY